MIIIRYERKTQPMIRKGLLLLPLVLVGCTSNNVDKGANNIKRESGKIYINVLYSFIYEKRCFQVVVNEENEHKTFDVPVNNYYYIDTTIRLEDYTFVHNEYFVATNELFVYSK